MSEVWTNDGRLMYFITTKPGWTGGEIKSIGKDGRGERTVADGNFLGVAPSFEGSRLFAVAGPITSHAAGVLLVMDTSGAILDSFPGCGSEIDAVCAGCQDDLVYYSSRFSGIFRLNLSTGAVDTILIANLPSRRNFDVSGDSLLCSPLGILHLLSGSLDTVEGLSQPRFCPTDPGLLLSNIPHDNYGFHGDLMLVNHPNGSRQYLNANPYRSSDLSDACWDVSGGKIFFTAAKLSSGGPFGYLPEATSYSLWALELHSSNH